MTTWTEKTQQSETWTPSTSSDIGVFDPFVFDRAPIFDTASTAGLWSVRTQQSETWTEV